MRIFQLYRSPHFRRYVFWNALVGALVASLMCYLRNNVNIMEAIKTYSVPSVLAIFISYPFFYEWLLKKVANNDIQIRRILLRGIGVTLIVCVLVSLFIELFFTFFGNLDMSQTVSTIRQSENPMMAVTVTGFVMILGGFMFMVFALPFLIPIGGFCGYINYRLLKNTRKEDIDKILNPTKASLP